MNAQQQEAPVPGLDTLARERLPSRDLWAGIEARIQKPVARRRADSLWPYGLAASISAAMLVGALLREHSPFDPQASGLSPTVAVEVLQTDSATVKTPYSNRDGQARGSSLLSARTLRTLRSESLDDAPAMVAQRAEPDGFMKATYSSGSSQQPHSQQAILRAHLRLVSQAEREVRRALRADPESASLKSLLSVAQQKREQLITLLVHEQD